MNIALLCLAAGCSARMGNVKQLLAWGQGTVLQAALHPLSALNCEPKMLVLGACADAIMSALEKWPERERWQVVLNEFWIAGMATSLVTGIQELRSWEIRTGQKLDSVMIALGDMPNLEKSVLDKLLLEASLRGRDAIVAPVFQGHRGHPVLLGRAYWDEILELRGDCGAAPILQRHQDKLFLVPASEGICEDIDTPEQWQLLRPQ